MRHRVIGVGVLCILAFAFFVPFIYVQPQGVFFCPANGCNFAKYGSITYWAFKVGGVWMDFGYYMLIL